MNVAVLKRDGDRESAARLRELADRVESGDVRDFAVVADDQGEQVFWTVVAWSDRWRILGALEHAKSRVFEG